jgi:plasmid stabilization system protein ParE
VVLPIRITRSAAAQIEGADQWWLEHRPLAPGAVREDIQAALALLRRQPGVGANISNANLKNVRRLHLGRIRYYIYYQVRDDGLVILAFWHSSRGSKPAL